MIGHSLGGVYISQAAPRIAERLSRLVFLVAFVLGDSECLYDTLPESLRTSLQDSTRDGLIPLDYAFVRNGFLSIADDGTAREVFAELSPQGDTTFTARVDQTGSESLVADGEVGVSYIDVLRRSHHRRRPRLNHLRHQLLQRTSQTVSKLVGLSAGVCHYRV